jgi:hypothetical protein
VTGLRPHLFKLKGRALSRYRNHHEFLKDFLFRWDRRALMSKVRLRVLNFRLMLCLLHAVARFREHHVGVRLSLLHEGARSRERHVRIRLLVPPVRSKPSASVVAGFTDENKMLQTPHRAAIMAPGCNLKQ